MTTANELLGQKLGSYSIESILGSGGMAVVYRARNPQDEVVALKVLFPPPGTGTEILTRFEREARTAARLNHPAIVRVFDVGRATGLAFMAMTLVEGQTLTTRLAQVGKFDETTAADIAWQIADALYYAHRQGVVHRDVKSSNILLTGDGQALLTDFGVAQALDDSSLTRTGHTVGTPAYMAPEQATGKQTVDGRADLYSLGVMLYQMVTGQVPFQGSTPQVLHAHVYDPPAPPSTVSPVSPAMEAIILRAMAKDVTERFQTGAAMAQALAELDDQTEAQVEAVPTGTHESLRQPLPQRVRAWPARLIGGILLPLLVAAVGIAVWSFSRSTPTIEPVDPISAAIVTTSTVTTPTSTATPFVQPSPAPRLPTSTPVSLVFPVGTLLKGSGDGIFRVNAKGTLQHIYDWPTFLAFGFAQEDIQNIDDSTLDELLPETGELTRLLQGPDQTIYWVINGQRWQIRRWQSALAENGYLGEPPSPADEALLVALPLEIEDEELPEGTLTKIGNNLYRLFANGVLRNFDTPERTVDYGYTSGEFVEIPQGVQHLYQYGSPLTKLLHAEGSEDIFLIAAGKRQPMPPRGAELWAKGYALEDIQQVSVEFLERFPLAETELSAATSPPAPTEPAATPIPPTTTPCPQPIDEALVALLDAALDEPLDCPRTQAVITPAAWQPFENGLMLWRRDLNLIYVIEGNNWLTPVGDRWREGDPPNDPSIVAPSGYYQPGRGFGLVWREQPGVRAALGWGLTAEVGFTTTIQEFTRGLVWYDPERGRLMILYNSGAYQLVQVPAAED